MMRMCRAICPQRRNCARYLTRRRRIELWDTEYTVFSNYPYDDKKMKCKYFIRAPYDD